MASILLVEDNDDHAILAQSALSSADQVFEVDRVASADECLARLSITSYDAIVLDYSLPKKSGLEILKDIEKTLYDVPVVMITSHGDEQIAVEAMKCGAYDYVSKSDDYLNKLPLVLQKAIENHELAKDRAELQARIGESENRLKTIFENVEVGIIEIRDNCTVSYANPRAKQYLGTGDDLDSNDICDLFSKDRTCDRCILGQCFKKKGATNYEIEYGNRNFSIAITAILDPDGVVSQLVAVLMDVTRQKKLQQQLIQSERIRALGRMASGVAHDFNNILAAILGRTELLLMSPKDREEVEKGLEIIREAAINGADTVKRIQEFTRVAKQRESTRIKMNDIVNDAVKMTEPGWKDQAQRDGIKIDISMALNSDLPIAGSASDLKEVLTNMIFNALEAMPDGGTISLKTYDKENSVFLSISDTGTGMSPDVIDSIFEPFFTTKGVAYAGLGLSVAYGIVNGHKGKISVDSTPNEGTTFTIKLPACPEEAQTKENPYAQSQTRRANVLVIDDEETIRELLTNIMARFNHDVSAVSDGASGIEAFGKGKYDIVFTDLGMPEMSGWEVAQRVKAIDPNVTVVLITGWGVELDKSELEKKKVDSVISKPFQVKQIVETISKALESDSQ